ncbi:Endolytic peptidoglycan transglycosylase RlpA [Flavobacterium sp. CECT 9288]|uniref:septal ring lytic transglycosylase RlpA family protein n=1 Tax=Flavobacterium sp. CECT 9288 TaxID=2845819 RepID=UPI001E3F9653|nr:septal ring lytic transglycosylase RlpA family protein [Flavobacterium sp. CECT 9288]CAH0337244.1 Endolytic peptidoglycan transglycosylase RlpA [Flavobacterium sp. CECT 9288]
MKKSITLFIFLAIVSIAVCQTAVVSKQNAAGSKSVAVKTAANKGITEKDTIKKDKVITDVQEKKADSLIAILGTFKVYKKEAHASYYADKFNGKKTSSGRRFDNAKLTAAHKKLPFGTKVRVTNEKNGKSVIVEVIDRGPFVRSREIDLTKRAFMEIASNKGSGGMLVTLEVLNN